MKDFLSLLKTSYNMVPSSWSLLLPSTTILPAIVPIIIIILILFSKFLIKKTSSNPHPLPPGPTPLPFIGCTMQMLLNRLTFRWVDKLMEQFNTAIICIPLGSSTHVIAASCPTLACEFLRKQDTVFASRPDILSAYLISDGYRATIMSPSGEQWKKMRGIYTTISFLHECINGSNPNETKKPIICLHSYAIK